MGPALKLPSAMSVPEFLAWDAPGGARWQLLDGEPVAMARVTEPTVQFKTSLGT